MIYLIFLLSLILNFESTLAEIDPVDYVDPFLGTSSSRWMLFPGPTLPFGMVKLSPDNTDEWAMDAGYEYNINSISGFGFVHSWMMGSILTMPTIGNIKTNPGLKDDVDSGYRSRFSHDNETASPGYYSVFLDDYKIKAELTTTVRSGITRYTFPESEKAHILFDLEVPEEERSTILSASIKRVSDTEIEGHVSRINGWNEYTIYFVSKFSKSFHSLTGWLQDEIFENIEVIETNRNYDIGALVNFSTNDKEKVIVKTGISYVSSAQARLNLETETSKFGWDFDAIHQDARNAWSNLLRKIIVDSGSESDKTKFYTNLYRSYSARTIFSDINGKYVDMCEQAQSLLDPSSPVYGCDAFWNTFWNLNQLWGLVNPDILEKWVNSLLEIYDKGGWLPKGPGGIEYSSIMVASHEISLIVSAWQKGIHGFDINKAYSAVRSIQMNPAKPHECGGYVGNRNLTSYMNIGYVPADEGPVSNTLEYAYDDWCVAQLARSLSKTSDYEYFMKRAQYYKNVFDRSSGYTRPKISGGPWIADFTPVKSAVGKEDNFGTRDYVEGNAWQFTWFVPHDLKGLIEIMGRDEFNRRLELGFENSRPVFTSEFVNHSNQPNMQAPWLFNYSGKPWLTQYWVREVLDNYYGLGPVNGYPGDEDQGQMGAWFVMSAIGLFQMDGGSSINPVYELSSPLFEKITIKLDQNYYEGKEFVIEAKNLSSENRFIQSVQFNNQAMNKFWIYHDDVVRGGRLILEMGSKPNKSWASNSDLPQIMDIDAIVTTPYITDTEILFLDKKNVKITCDTEGIQIFYTLDGSDPDNTSFLYTDPFPISETTIIKMKAFKNGKSSLVSASKIKRAVMSDPIPIEDTEKGLTYRYFHGSFRMVNDFKDLKPFKEGNIDKFTISPKDHEQFFAFDFEGLINIPQDGLYTFYLASNDGGRLYIDDIELINNDGLHPFVEISSQVALRSGLHPIRVKYFQEGGTSGLVVSWKGPRFSKQEIPSKVVYHKMKGINE